jgi:hypothetical protein
MHLTINDGIVQGCGSAFISSGSIKNVQVTEEAFSSQKMPSNTSKHELLKKFLLLWLIFALLDPDPDSESGSPIESGSNPDPEPW